MTTIEYHVPEMHCGACEASIRKALGSTPGVDQVEVDLQQRRVKVHFSEGQTDVLKIRDRIEAAGFDVG